MKKSELFTKEMMESFTCHPYAVITSHHNHLYLV